MRIILLLHLRMKIVKKRFRKQSDLIKAAVKNIQPWTQQERLCQNVLELNGIKNATLEIVRQVILRQQRDETNRKYKEFTK